MAADRKLRNNASASEGLSGHRPQGSDASDATAAAAHSLKHLIFSACLPILRSKISLDGVELGKTASSCGEDGAAECRQGQEGKSLDVTRIIGQIWG